MRYYRSILLSYLLDGFLADKRFMHTTEHPVILCWFCGLKGVADPCQDCRGTALSGPEGIILD